MKYNNLIVETEDGIAIVKINRPKVLNAVNKETLLELENAMHELNEDTKIRVIIITGEGKSFISGSDISRLKEFGPLEAREYSKLGHRVLDYIENMSKPVIAAINGYALGSGCELAMACDIRIAAENAKIGQPEVKLGVIPGHAGTQRLPKLVGIAKAKELIFTGDMITAQEAKDIGLVNKVVPPDKLMDDAKALAKKIISVGKNAVSLAKSAINKAFTDAGNAYEQEAFAVCFALDESKEGISAFLEKRKPNW